MKQSQYLVIGGSGEAGQSAITCLKAKDPSAFIITTTTTNEPVSNADLTLFGKTATTGLSEKIQEDLQNHNISPNFRAIIYTPALGEVGFPIIESSPNQIEETLGICLYPLLDLEESIKPELTIAYSAFYWLSHTLSFYGSMGVAKYKADKWALENPQKRKIIRAGTFYSKSVRGISIVLQRTMKKTNNPDLLTLKRRYEESDQKFMDFFLSYAWEHEKEAFQSQWETPYRPTERRDLSRGLEYALDANEPIVTVLGDWTWKETKLPVLPDWFKQF
ncbi:hypothetical protein ND861_00680 [Leptospira sp. 2 VSF19]|uniref:SDR family NAD(P)-dependent oxidoreductase n=1 Tax=Leptospira soteropolitanensis TaxID=2950025 RepID=A0AAW5VF64_9LEPT|nr:hypothetical protein [Leptospira soteropolitanensis]MCW7491157.1 hypothetical protein [Leptospira soteropolitanensis]MCW7498741.1 hypothetical protein [Leptospira soteropolitanensis]MCW7521666.1 hypothetical protein [Leptospira soteropolitanensis]MCW7524845.1 hypothetical protein [Leptospira soteropolitanensis]MCW7528712.1 hypothetical protein [Leptospira soteropolitanensis]